MSPTLVAPSKMPRFDYFQRSSFVHKIEDESREEGARLPERPSIDPPGTTSPRTMHTLEDNLQIPPLPQRVSFDDSVGVRRVSFDDSVSIRLYNTVLGDNPSVRNGPPVSLGWVYTPDKRPMGSQQPRKPNRCYLDAPTRIERLRKSGFTIQEMEEAVAEVKNLQGLRRNNLNLIVRTKAPVVTESRKRPLSPKVVNAGPPANTSFRAKKEDFLPLSNPQQRQPWEANHYNHNFHHHPQYYHEQPSRPKYYYYAIGTRTPPPSSTSREPFRIPTYHIPRSPPLQPLHPPPSVWRPHY